MHYAKQDMFEKAILYFERASQIQTKEVKWKLMIASCYRRMSLFNEALKVYEDIHNENPENIDCLKGLVQIRKELNMPYSQYGEKLVMLDREAEAQRMMNPQYQAQGGYPNQDMGVGYAPQYDISQAQQFQPQMPDMGGITAPSKARKMAAKANDDEDEGWGDAGALLD